ncbi:ACT domain-containing protein [Alicyclobacillus curvatus]|jgi:chorismate mutase|nr:ACT domain-containing protein [Alicyclobacillus curvatus]
MPEDPYYLIRRSHLPEVMKKTVEVMELLQRRKDLSVQEAAQEVGISRSAFYKYKDVVKPFYSSDMGRIITISLVLRHVAGVLSEVLGTFSRIQANILTINQAIPLQGTATVTVSLDTQNIVVDMDSLFSDLREIHGVEEVTLVGQSV